MAYRISKNKLVVVDFSIAVILLGLSTPLTRSVAMWPSATRSKVEVEAEAGRVSSYRPWVVTAECRDLYSIRRDVANGRLLWKAVVDRVTYDAL